MDVNKEVFAKILEKVNKLKEKVKAYENALFQIKNYNNSQINLTEILSQTSNFLLAQKTSMEIEGKIELTSPTYFGQESESNINFCMEMIEKYKLSLEKRIYELQTCLDNLNKEIDDSYVNLKKIKYRLLSILMHEGSAGNFFKINKFS